jgi:hypothetical protein
MEERKHFYIPPVIKVWKYNANITLEFVTDYTENKKNIFLNSTKVK